ncbi:hypothetical protein EDC04DRAFT_2862964 [Pisolithus marmoratus]|nr:hypothetical protein EDC04DRAFT_2862964 [Pisolithus marmoratus]
MRASLPLAIIDLLLNGFHANKTTRSATNEQSASTRFQPEGTLAFPVISSSSAHCSSSSCIAWSFFRETLSLVSWNGH